MQPFRKIQNAGSCSRAHIGKSVPQSWCDGATRNSVTWTLQFLHTTKSHRGACDRLPSFLPCRIGGGCHTSVRFRVGWHNLSARERGRTRNGSIPNSYVLTGVASWWWHSKLEDVGVRSPPVRGKFGGSESPRCSTHSVPFSCIGMEAMVDTSLVAIPTAALQLFGGG